jgi:hypothetical protein
MAIRIGPAGSDSLGYMKALSRGVEVTLINESPQAYPDAAMMKRVIRQLLKAASG